MYLLKLNPGSRIWCCLWVIWVEFDSQIYRGGQLQGGWPYSGPWVPSRADHKCVDLLRFVARNGRRRLVQLAMVCWVMFRAHRGVWWRKKTGSGCLVVACERRKEGQGFGSSSARNSSPAFYSFLFHFLKLVQQLGSWSRMHYCLV